MAASTSSAIFVSQNLKTKPHYSSFLLLDSQHEVRPIDLFESFAMDANDGMGPISNSEHPLR